MPEALPRTYEALRLKVSAEVLNETATETQVRFILRVPRGVQTTRWLDVCRSLLQLERNAQWSMDLSRNYFLMPQDQEDMRYRWRVIIQGLNLSQYDAAIAARIREVRFHSRTQIDEVPLHGNPNRSRTAGPIGSVPIGPAARRV